MFSIDGRDGSADGNNFKEGQYELVFYVGDYFKKIVNLPKTPFLDEVVIKFGISILSMHTLHNVFKWRKYKK